MSISTVSTEQVQLFFLSQTNMAVLVAGCGACDAGEREVTHLATQFNPDPVFVLAACRHPAVHATVDVQRQTERITTVTPGHE